MGRDWLLGSCLALGIVACSAPTNSLDALPTLAPTSVPVEEPALEIVGGRALNAGQLAYVSADNNIYVLSPDTDSPIAITDDAVPVEGGLGRVYHSPTWSPGGWLAYVKTEVSSNGELTHAVYAVQSGDTARQLYETDAGSYVYGYWSPAECDQGVDCGRFAFLMNGPSGSGLELHMAQVRSDDQAVSEGILGEGGPFYYSWAPDGERMLWLRGGTTLEIVDINAVEDSVLLPDEPGIFQAPWWSPIDERLLFALGSDEGNHLVVADGDARSDLTHIEGGMLSAFAWAPNGQGLAYAEGYAPPGWPFTSLRFVSADGQSELPLVEDEDVAAFFWAPDSQQVAYITLSELPDDSQAGGRTSGHAAPARQEQLPLTWNVIDVTTGDARELARFAPTRSQLYIYQFFDQFAQSHNVWSPDSSQIVYAEVSPTGEGEVIKALDVATPGAEPVIIAEGSLGVFSFDQ
jgi:TolB protein